MMRRTHSPRLPSSRGFTLVELLVAMVAGLMVALAVVQLSKEATNTFHEESRAAAAEMQLRTAIDRLRADLQRAAYMSTGNIWIDPAIATTPGTTTNVANIPSSFQNANHMSLYDLAGVRLFAGGSNTSGSLGLETANGLTPDAIEIAGNFTSVEQLGVGGSQITANGQVLSVGAVVDNGGCNGTGQRVYLDTGSSPSIWRLVGLSGGDAGTSDAGGPSDYAQTLLSTFQPVNAGPTGGGAVDGGTSSYPAFIVRYVDPTGKVQYAATCKDYPAAGWNLNSTPYVDLNPSTPLRSTKDLSGGLGGTGAFAGGTINPIQIVRWEIQASTMQDPLGNDSAKYDLTRTYLDAFGNVAGSPEVVAEYAVDLKFAFTVDTTTDTSGNYVGGTMKQAVYSLEDSASNAAVAKDVTTIAAGTAGPQRIRAIRARVVTRAAQADRTMPSPTSSLYTPTRYCTNGLPDGSATCTNGNQAWARTRTVITEVALPNQSRLWFE